MKIKCYIGIHNFGKWREISRVSYESSYPGGIGKKNGIAILQENVCRDCSKKIIEFTIT